jgi:hypothetical protein
MDARHEELAAMATRVQQCGPITDYFWCGPRTWAWTDSGRRSGRLALCRCIHGKEWPEGGSGEAVCQECVREAMQSTSAQSKSEDE